jgi:hypothetical protein
MDSAGLPVTIAAGRSPAAAALVALPGRYDTDR